MNWQADRQAERESSWADLCRRMRACSPDCSLRLLLLAAHPDDEAIGASAVLARFPRSLTVFLTDGAPRDPSFWTGGPYDSREHYAQTRQEEAKRALALAGVTQPQIFWLGAVDQDAAFEITTLVEKFRKLIAEHKPDVVITHPYEGGHPDHDSAALIAKMALALVTDIAPPELLEMTSYHARDGQCLTGEFLDPEALEDSRLRQFTRASAKVVFELSEEDRQRKRRMLDAYSSQRLVLENFSIGREPLRPAPEYDFSRPPHPGKLWYECMEWPMTGARWRELAVAALHRVEAPSC